MKKAEKENPLSDSNWGSRKGCSAQDAATVKALHYDLVHLTLKEYATMENDAKSCYDRMVPNLILLLSRSFGIKKVYVSQLAHCWKKPNTTSPPKEEYRNLPLGTLKTNQSLEAGKGQPNPSLTGCSYHWPSKRSTKSKSKEPPLNQPTENPRYIHQLLALLMIITIVYRGKAANPSHKHFRKAPRDGRDSCMPQADIGIK